MSGEIWNHLFISHSGIQNIKVDHSNKKFVYRVYNPQLRHPIVDSNGIQHYDIVNNDDDVNDDVNDEIKQLSKCKIFDLSVNTQETEDRTRTNINKAINDANILTNNTSENLIPKKKQEKK